jgi:ABC-type multidrug transport system fused ATPase/permease subunit
MSTPNRTPDMDGRTEVFQRSFGELMGEVTQDLSVLMRQELELAKAELRQDAKRAGRVGGMATGAAVAGLMVLIFLSVALWWGLSNVMDGSWAALIVAAIWGVVAAALTVAARNNVKRLQGLSRTAETIKEVPNSLKPDLGAYR